MLDYILSKMVLLIFLLLLVAAFSMVRESLNVYFVQQAAQNLAKSLASDVTRVVTSVRNTTEVRSYLLPATLRAGTVSIRYELNAVVYEKGSTKYLGIIVLDGAGRKWLGFETVPLGESSKYDVTVHIPKGMDVLAIPSGTEQQYFIVQMTYTPGTDKTELDICVKPDPNVPCK